MNHYKIVLRMTNGETIRLYHVKDERNAEEVAIRIAQIVNDDNMRHIIISAKDDCYVYETKDIKDFDVIKVCET